MTSFEQAIQVLSRELKEKQPQTFNSTWILKNTPPVYRFIWKNVRLEAGGVDWDTVTRALNKALQKKWKPCRWQKKLPPPYENHDEIERALKRYSAKLYTFIAVQDVEDRTVQESIAITLTRIAQKGNVVAKERLISLLRYTIDQWIESSSWLAIWKGYSDEINLQIERCIRCYRFTGTFLGYLFKTLEYAGRGLRPLVAYSLDETLPDRDYSRGESVVRDVETGEIRMYGKG